jgi:hypothetical protein
LITLAITCSPLAAYKNFFTLWKNAEPVVPILKQAKAEYAKLPRIGGIAGAVKRVHPAHI